MESVRGLRFGVWMKNPEGYGKTKIFMNKKEKKRREVEARSL